MRRTYGSGRTLHHTLQEQSGSSASELGEPALGHALAGSVATASTKLLLYPLELIVARLQVQRQLHGPKEAPSAAQDADAEYTSVIDAARKIYKHEGGLRAFYTSCAPDVAKGITDSFLFFLAFTFVRQYELRKRGGTKHLTVFKELSVGIAAGALAKLVTTPLQNIITRQQTAALVVAREPKISNSTLKKSTHLSIREIARQIYAERGIQGFWAGYSASIILTLNPAITFAVDNLFKRLLSKSRQTDSSPQVTFLLAAISKAIATSITYPVMLAKSRAQAASPTTAAEAGSTKGDRDASPKYLDKPNMNSTPTRRKLKEQLWKTLGLLNAQYAIFLSLRKIYRTEGVQGLYSGLEGEVMKGFLSHGLTMMMKERLHVGVIQLYCLLLRLRRQWPSELQKAQEGAQEVAADARERMQNIGETVSEGTKKLVEEGKKRVGSDQ